MDFTINKLFWLLCVQGVKNYVLQRFSDDRGGKNKHVFYLAKLWLMHRLAARWSYGWMS